jgi:intraflagellar transport protein 56
MLLSRLRPGRRKKPDDFKERSGELKKLDEFLEKRDYMGAISLLEHERKSATSAEQQQSLAIWLGYCHFHVNAV